MITRFRRISSFIILFLAVACLGLPFVVLFAADAVAVPVLTAAPAASASWALLLIPMITPVLIMVAKLAIPKLPKPLIPIIAPILGAGLEIVLHLAGAGSGGPLMGAILGSAGVGLREIADQMRPAKG